MEGLPDVVDYTTHFMGDWTGAALQKAAVTAVLKRHARQAAREATCRFRSQRPPRQA